MGKRDGEESSRVVTSAANGLGLAELRQRIASMLSGWTGDGSTPIGSGFREGLERAGEAIKSAAALANGPGGEELIAAEIRRAVDDLGAIVGVVVTEDILDRIFRRFCVGK